MACSLHTLRGRLRTKTAGWLRPVSVVGMMAWIDELQVKKAQKIFTEKRKNLSACHYCIGNAANFYVARALRFL